MAGDHDFQAALDRLVEHDYLRLVRAVALFSGTTEGADDAVQEALARALEQRRRGRDIHSLEAWVVTTAFNQCRSRARRAGRWRGREAQVEVQVEGALEHSTGADAEALGGQLLDLRAAVRSLPTRQREVVVMHYYLDQPITTIGAALGVAPGAVKNALHKARGSLLAALTVDNTPRSAS